MSDKIFILLLFIGFVGSCLIMVSMDFVISRLKNSKIKNIEWKRGFWFGMFAGFTGFAISFYITSTRGLI